MSRLNSPYTLDELELLVEVLKEKDALELFVRSMGSSGILYMLGKIPRNSWLSGSFNWDLTPEGWYFWQEINNDWLYRLDGVEECY